MATYTSHYNLKKPATSDKIRIADFNGNADTIDATMYDNATLGAQLKADIGIVENTNTATHNISAGQYVIWKGALYTASSAISSGATLSSANLTAVSGGGLNALNSKLTLSTNTSVSNLVAHKSLNTIFLTFYSFSIGGNGKTLTQVVPSGYRPYVKSAFVGKTYNGSSYVDCIITFDTDGSVTITDLFSNAIANIQAGYTTPKQFMYEYGS